MYESVLYKGAEIDKIVHKNNLIWQGNKFSSDPELWEVGWWDVNTGRTSGSSAHFRTKPSYKIQVIPGKEYTFKGDARIVVLEYRSDGTYTGRNTDIGTPPQTIKMGPDTSELSLFLFRPNVENNINNIKDYNFEIR